MPLTDVANTFGAAPLERRSERRGDAAWIAAMRRDPAASWIVLSEGRPLLSGERPRLERLSGPPPWPGLSLSAPAEEVFLAVTDTGPVFAVEAETAEGQGFADLRAVAAELPGEDAALAATARALFAWRRRHGFCANCGTATAGADAGWKRVCPACRAEHFPRTDPVVIMLALQGDRCLLGRGASWPAGRFSALAGFLEPGETIEAACARELKEESGLTAVRVRYHSSQPWPLSPLGGQLMIGLFAEVADGEAVADGTELAEVRWVTREEARAVLAGTHAEVTAPPPMAIAHQLLKTWAG